MILKHFRGCWARVYIFSPTAVLDKTWDPVRKHLQEDLGIDLKKEPAFFEEWDDGATLSAVISRFLARSSSLTTGATGRT